MHTIAPVPQSFRKNDYAYALVAREGNVAIYSQSGYRRKSRRWEVFAYEVVKIRARKARVVFGTELPATEYLPSDGEWGLYGKTYSASCVSGVEARRAAEGQLGSWAGVAGARGLAA